MHLIYDNKAITKVFQIGMRGDPTIMASWKIMNVKIGYSFTGILGMEKATAKMSTSSSGLRKNT